VFSELDSLIEPGNGQSTGCSTTVGSNNGWLNQIGCF